MTSRTRCWLLPKGSKFPPPQGQKSYFLLRSPNLAKPWADQRLDPPALLAVAAAPLAFGMIGDFPLRIAEEIPIPVSIQILTSSLVFQGGLPPVFRRIFALCPAFQRWVGYLPYPREESGTQGRQWCLLILHSGGVYCFRSVFPATSRRFPRAARTFQFSFRYRSRRKTVSLLHFRDSFVTDVIFINILLPQPLLRNSSRQERK